MGTFVVDLKKVLDEGKQDELQEFMDWIVEENNKEIINISNNLQVSKSCAQNIWYLRTRSRWSQELEDKLIELHKAGTPPNIMEFGCGNTNT